MTISWLNSKSGLWSSLVNWDFGAVPTALDDVAIDLAGTYKVTIASPAQADDLYINDAGATLQETTSGLTLAGGLTLDAGRVIFDHVNSIGSSMVMTGGQLVLNAGATIGAPLLISGGELLANASLTVSTGLTLSHTPTFAVATGKTLKLTGNTLIYGPTTLVFGAAGKTGTVDWASSVSASGSDYNIEVQAGTLRFDSFSVGLLANNSAWTSCDIAAGATLDLNGSPTHIGYLSGAGFLTSKSIDNLVVDNGTFAGSLTGDVGLTVDATLTLTGHDLLGAVTLAQNAALVTDVGATLQFNGFADVYVASNTNGQFLVNKGTLYAHGLSGSNRIECPLINDGTMIIDSGAIDLESIFNNGIIEGTLTPVLGSSDILWAASASPKALDFLGGGGDNVFKLSAAPHSVDGGAGTDTIDVLKSMTFAAGSINNVERFVVADGVSANLSKLTAGETIILASYAGGGATTVVGTQGADVITCGAGQNRVAGGGGADTINAGAGVDTFVYHAASDSTGANCDTINGFNFAVDDLSLASALGPVGAIGKAVTNGALSTSTFDADLAVALGAGQLGAHDALLFTPSSGSLAGETFLVVDLNGQAGYQAGADLVINLVGKKGTLALSNFV